MLPDLSSFRKRNARRFGSGFLAVVGPAKRDTIEDPVVLLATDLDGHPLARLQWKRLLENNPLGRML